MMFIVATGASEFAGACMKALLLHCVEAKAHKILHSQPLHSKAEGEDNYNTEL